MRTVKFFQCGACCVSLVFFVFGIYNFVYKLEENKCEMTYMFEYPQYIVSLLL